MRNRHIPEDDLREIAAQLRGVDHLITALLIGTGFRLDDVMHLRCWQLGRDAISIRERKTGHARAVTIPADLSDLLRAYIAGRHPFRYAFPALRRGGAGKMHRTTYWRHFKAAARRLGMGDRGYTPHSLRKGYAVKALSRTGSLKAVQDDLGHTSPMVTALYALSDRLGDA